MTAVFVVIAVGAAWWLTLRWAVNSGAFKEPVPPAPGALNSPQAAKRTLEEIRALMTSYDAGSLTIGEIIWYLNNASPGEHMTWTYGDRRGQAGFVATTCPDCYDAATGAVNRRHIGNMRRDAEVPQV